MTETRIKAALKYEHPPINEVVFGVWFPLIKQLKAVHWGLLWERFKSEYPETQQMDRLGPLATGDNVEFALDSPRLWFVHPGGNKLVQIQTDAFFFNWRKQGVDETYPGYTESAEEFRRQYTVFHSFVREMEWGEIEPVAYDLSYIDLIDVDEKRDILSEFGYFFPDFRWRELRPTLLSMPVGINWQTHFAVPDESGFVKLSLASARLSLDQKPVIRMEINARGIREKQKAGDMLQWFNEAHRGLIEIFSHLASDDAQRNRWRLHE